MSKVTFLKKPGSRISKGNLLHGKALDKVWFRQYFLGLDYQRGGKTLQNSLMTARVLKEVMRSNENLKHFEVESGERKVIQTIATLQILEAVTNCSRQNFNRLDVISFVEHK